MIRRLLLVFAVFIAVGIAPAAAAAQKKPWTPPKLGTWKVTGSDEEGLKWSGKLYFTARGLSSGKYKYRGYFDWLSADRMHSGREFFSGTFDAWTGKLSIVGYRVARAKGDIAPGRYLGRVKSKGTLIYGGTWGGNDVVNGKWSAGWSRSR